MATHEYVHVCACDHSAGICYSLYVNVEGLVLSLALAEMVQSLRLPSGRFGSLESDFTLRRCWDSATSFKLSLCFLMTLKSPTSTMVCYLTTDPKTWGQLVTA